MMKDHWDQRPGIQYWSQQLWGLGQWIQSGHCEREKMDFLLYRQEKNEHMERKDRMAITILRSLTWLKWKMPKT
jgi:hypothetical protein